MVPTCGLTDKAVDTVIWLSARSSTARVCTSVGRFGFRGGRYCLLTTIGVLRVISMPGDGGWVLSHDGVVARAEIDWLCLGIDRPKF